MKYPVNQLFIQARIMDKIRRLNAAYRVTDMLDQALKWLVNHAEGAALLCVGSFLYATIRSRQMCEQKMSPSVLEWLLDFVVAGGCGVIFMAGGSALGLEGAQIGFIGGVGGYMGPRGMKTLGDGLTKFVEMKSK